MRLNRLRPLGHPHTDPFGIFDKVLEASEKNAPLIPGDVLLLWGGMDIAPKMYDQIPNRYCSAHAISQRDQEEWECLHEAVNKNIPIIGICRGAQMLTIYTGGTLVQHVNNHGRSHEIMCHDTNEILKCNSAHHQVCQPIYPAEILSSAAGEKGYGEDEEEINLPEIPEIILFPHINAIGFQFHPEWSDCPRETIRYCADAIKKYLCKPIESTKEAA